MRWTAVRSGALLLGLMSCGGTRNETTPGAQGAGQATPSTAGETHVRPPEGGGAADSGGAPGAGPGSGSPTCARDPLTTCPGTMSGRWCVETFPAEGQFEPQGVWSDRPDNAWAVGWRFLTGGDREAVLMHWSGCVWSEVANPDTARFQYARGVWGVGPNDLWIVGDGFVVLHFDGQSLTPVPVPVTGGQVAADIASASGSASNDVWASGFLPLHWDGTSWTAVSIPTNNPNQYFADIWANAANDVWTVGDQAAAHFDGSSWTVDEIVTGPMGISNFLYTVWSSGAEAWAAGPGNRIHHFQNGQWTLTTTPTDSGPLLYDLGGMNGDVHLVGSQSTLRILENDTTFAPVTDAPAEGGVYQGVWVSQSQVWVAGTTTNNVAMLIRRAR
jgi:hypothetical protein